MIKYAFLIVVLAIPGTAFAATLPTILVEKADPQPVEPGRDLTIDVTFFNRLTSDTGTFSVELEHGPQLVFKSSSEDLSRVSLCGGCSQKNKYFLSVEPTTVSGTYPVYIKAQTSDATVRQKVDVKVQGRPNLIFSAEPEGLNNITPNSQFVVSLEVTNIGSGQARQIKIQPESAAFSVLGGAVRTIDTLNATETGAIRFDFAASSSLAADSYSIPFRLVYLDEQGTLINSSQNLGVRVVNKGEVNIQTIKVVANTGSPVITVGQPFTVIARLENTGDGNADSVAAGLECPFAPAKKAFIGQLKKDEDAPAVFDVVSSRTGNHKCSLVISYKDDTGAYELADSFEVAVTPPNLAGAAVPVLAIAAVLAYVFRKRLPFFKKK